MRKNKRMQKSMMAYLLSVGLLLSGVPTSVTATSDKEKEAEYLVVAKGKTAVEHIEDKYDGESVKSEENKSTEIVKVSLTEKEKNTLYSENGVKSIEKDSILTGSNTGETEITSKNDFQWNIDAINASTLNVDKNEKSNVKVAILDSGVTLTEDINVVQRINLLEGEENVEPLYDDVMGHGTSVASVIGAKKNDMGVTGVNPNADIISVKVMDQNQKAKASDVIEGLYWCINHKVNIVNMSFGTLQDSQALHQAIKDADNAGILLIAAAGNNGDQVEYPAAYSEVMAVGAINGKGNKSSFSSYGKELEVMAPGENIPSLDFFDKGVLLDGTSLAAPHIAGMASIIWEQDATKSSDFVRYVIDKSCKSMNNEEMYGNGIADVSYALNHYREYEKEFVGKQDKKIEDTNNSKMRNYSDVEVTASWDKKAHRNVVNSFGKETYYSPGLVGAAIYDVDEDGNLKYVVRKNKQNKPIDDYRNIFHGHRNYIANTLYLLEMARVCSTEGIDKAMEVSYPVSKGDTYKAMLKGKEALRKAVPEIEKNHPNLVKIALEGDEDHKKHSQEEVDASIILGVAIHIAMDTYAHKAMVKEPSGKWTVLQGDSYHDAQDSTTNTQYQGPVRWKCAKEIAYASLYVWDNRIDINGILFHIDYHDKNKFKLLNFATYMKRIDSESYQADKSWYENRTYKLVL